MQQVECAFDSEALGWSASGELEVLSFELGDQTFAIRAVRVREIMDHVEEAAIPGAPPLVAGVINFRGRIIPVADLRRAFGMEAAAVTRDSRIVVIEIALAGETTLVGLKTDKVHEVATFTIAECEEAPMIGLRWRRDYARKLIRRDSNIIVLLHLQNIFDPLVSTLQ